MNICSKCKNEIKENHWAEWNQWDGHFHHNCEYPDQPQCTHPEVTVYSRLISVQTWWEPAEYEFKITCDACGEEFDETPAGSKENEVDWEDYYEGDI